jgi:RND superfamily putative drug exporter
MRKAVVAAPEPPDPRGPGAVYAWLVVGLRFVVLPAWIAFALLAWQHGSPLARLPEAQVDALIPSGLAAARDERRIDALFGSSLLPRLAVVVRAAGGLTAEQRRAILRQAARLDRGELPGDYPPGAIAAPYLNVSRLVPAARERNTTAITYIAFPRTLELNHQRNLAQDYADTLGRATGLDAHVTGFVAGNLEQSSLVSSHLLWVTLATLAVVAAIIGLTMRSLLAPLVTLVAAGIAWLVGTRALSWLGAATGTTLQREVEPIVAVLLLGVVTDYAVFFLAGARSRLLAGTGRHEAAERTTAQFVPIVFTAGWLVAFGLATLRAGSIGFVQALGPSLALVVLVSMAVSISFVPAAIAVFGRVLFWPGLRERPEREPRAFVARRFVALPVAVVLAAALLYGATDLRDLRLGVEPIAALPGDAGAARGARDASLGFAPGIVAPTEVAVREPLRLGRVEGVAAIVGGEHAPRIPEVQRLFRRDGWHRYLAVLEHDPYGARGTDDLRRLRAALPPDALVAGDTAIAAGTVDRIRGDVVRVAIAALLVNLVLLAAFLRALVAPLLLIAASAAGLAATFGLTTLVFQGLLGYGQLTYYVPLAVGVLLLSFGSDYNLFVVGRIWQEARHLPVGDAIRVATPRASRAISVAGIALALSFASLAIVPLRPFREFAFATAVGVLIDTFVVRSYLIPALISLCGRLAWWPSRPQQTSTRA